MFDEKTEMIIERHFDDKLTLAERAEFERLLASDPDFKQRVANERIVYTAFRPSQNWRFSPKFAERVVRDWREEADLGALFRENRIKTFGEGFRQRVEASIRNEQIDSARFLSREVGDLLVRLFPRVAMPALAAGVTAIIMNVNAAAAGVPLMDALLGLPGDEVFEVSIIDLSAADKS